MNARKAAPYVLFVVAVVGAYFGGKALRKPAPMSIADTATGKVLWEAR